VTALTVATDERTYQVVRDAVLRFEALVVGRAVDELTGRPPLDRVRVRPILRGIAPDTPGEGSRFAVATGEGGTFAVTGTREQAFPDLAATTHIVDLSVDAPGYLHTPVAVAVPLGTTAFPIDAGTVQLRRDAVALKGRVTTGVPPTGVPLTSLRVVVPAGLVGFQTPFAFEHASGLTITPQPLAPVGPALALSEDVQRGATRVRLETRTGLALNEVVRFGTGGATEYAVVAGLEGPANLSEAGAANLRAPLAFPHRAADGPAQRVAPGVAGAPTTLTQGAFAEDRVAFVNDPTLLPDGGPALVAHADPTREEWVVVLRTETTTTAAGDYRILPLGRTAAVTVHVGPGPGVPTDPVHIVSYGQPENTLNLRV
jgi:hypothetical protein